MRPGSGIIYKTPIDKPASLVIAESQDGQRSPAKDSSVRAWLVVVGGVLIYFPTFGFPNAFGTFQTYYEEELLVGTSSSTIAWIGSLQIFLLFLGGLVVSPLYDKVGATRLLVPGTLVYVVSLMLTSLCKKYYQLILAQGVMFGCANALLFYPTIAALNQWFDKKTRSSTRPSEPGEHTDMQLDFKTILSDITYLLFSFGMLLVLWGMFIPFFFLPLYAASYGMSATEANNLLAYMNAGSFGGRVLTGHLSDRIGRFNMISLAALSCGILLYCLYVITTPGAIIVFSTLYGIFSGGLISLQSPCIGQITPDHSIIGVKIGLMMELCSAGGLTGSPIAGALLTANHGQWYGFIDFCASILTGGAVVTIASRIVASPKHWRF
ncbi:major facilitator superfamily domain-containing protein [Aspergillus leporis]|uniref:Major facilitator superfamily domain-containing protein n=1 Tax=Aspergillus leporis TaxID=41062 RepID=A0A5N5WM70_9EURO|nr:major facilitator superfamily domain-containing protein [Aspergillus leporis]